MSCKYLKSKIEEFQCSDGLKTTETFTCSLFESTDPTTATNIPDPEVDSNSTEMTEEYTEDVTIDVMPTDSTDTTGARSRMGR